MNPAPSGSIPALTGLRGYAALWVLLSHVLYTDSLSFTIGQRVQWKLVDGLLRHEYLAVDLFFMLSGFVLTHAHARDLDERIDAKTYVRFLLLRLARVYPLHLLALFGTLALTLFVKDAVPTPTQGAFFQQLALVASWGLCVGVSWNAPAWSLSSEWLAYLVLPLLILCSAQLKRLRVQLAVLLVLAAAFAHVFFSFQYALDMTNGAGASTRVLVGVALGCVLRRLYDQPRVRKLPWTALFWLAIPVALAFMTDLTGRRRDNNLGAYVGTMFVVFAAACASPRGLLPFTGRIPVYLGEISYAVYIFHYPLLRTMGLLAGRAPLDAIAADPSPNKARLVLFGSVIAVLGIAAIAHHTVEKPVRRIVRRWIDQRYPQ